MSTNKFTQPFTFEIKLSKNKQSLIVLPHVFIALLLCMLFQFEYIHISNTILAMVAVLASLVYFVRLELTQSSSKSVYAFHRKANESWSLVLKNETKHNFFISDSSFASNYLIILNFIDKSKNNYSVLITLDSVGQENYRRLKVLIKTKSCIE